MTKVIILRGPSGSGKSTYIKNVLGLTLGDPEYGSGIAGSPGKPGSAYIVSSDSYFMLRGQYVFEPKDLGDAHGKCLQNFIVACTSHGYDTIVVDNTNTTIVEIAPYVAIAEAYGASVEIHCMKFEKHPFELEGRNKHGVPASTIKKQIDRLNNSVQVLKSSFPRAKIVYVEAR